MGPIYIETPHTYFLDIYIYIESRNETNEAKNNLSYVYGLDR